jgi:hypothetical protein
MEAARVLLIMQRSYRHIGSRVQAHTVSTFLYECGTSKADSMADRLKGEA